MFQSWGAEVVSMKFLRLEAAIIDFDVRMPLHYTVIIKRKSLYFIFIRMFNYLSNHYFETRSNEIDRLFLPCICLYVFMCHVLCMCMFFLFARGCISCPGQTPEKACMYYVLCCYILCSHTPGINRKKTHT